MFPPIPKKKLNIYLDHAAATPLSTDVLRVMKPYFSDVFANPSSLHTLGVQARSAVESARSSVAQILGTPPDTIFFTSGGTESNNLALFGLTESLSGGHIITSKIEHDSVLRTVEILKKEYGFRVTFLPVDESGRVDSQSVKKALRKDTVLVSLMYANNEIGTIQDIAGIGREILKWRKEKKTRYPYFHTDAAQAAALLELSVEKLHVDLMTLNSGKIYGPKGVGALYVRRGVPLQAQNFGGKQEFGIRAGTQNVPGIVGFAKALEITQKKKEKTLKSMQKLQQFFWEQISSHIEDAKLNGPTLETNNRLPGNLNIYFPGVESEVLVLYLDAYGIFASSGSACSTESTEASHVLQACGWGSDRARESIRLSFGSDITKQVIKSVLKYLPVLVAEIRKQKTYENQ